MRVWTIQTPVVYDILISQGKFNCDEKKSSFAHCENFRKAYFWLISKMEEKIEKAPLGVNYPIWAWTKRPDLRCSGFAMRGETMVLIEVDIPTKSLLFTDFFAWHSVLNDIPEFENDLSDDEFDAKYDEFMLLSEEEKCAVKKKSWEGIILKYDGNFKNRTDIQATFWTLKKEDIRSVRFFKAK